MHLNNEVSFESLDQNFEKVWNTSFTDPKSHSNQGFRYLVHAIQNSEIGVLLQRMLLSSRGNYKIEERIDLIEDPLRVQDKALISCSIIDQDHPRTFGPGGLILNCDPSTVIAMGPQDLGIQFDTPEQVLEQYSDKTTIISPEELLKLSNSLNETLLKGKRFGGNLFVIGLFAKIHGDGEPWDKELHDKLKRRAIQLNLPFVEIVEEWPEFEKAKTTVLVGDIADFKTMRHLTIESEGFLYIVEFNPPRVSRMNKKRQETQLNTDYWLDRIYSLINSQIDTLFIETLSGESKKLEKDEALSFLVHLKEELMSK